MGRGLLVLALDHPARVRSLVLVSTSSAFGGDRSPLPGPTKELLRFTASADADWSDRGSVTEYLVAYRGVLAGGRRPFDERFARDVVRSGMARARNFASVQNHDAIPGDDRQHRPLSAIAAPTLVVHGTADPLFPIEHGEVLASAIHGARLLRLEGAGHGVEPADWETLAAAIADHTAEG